MPHQHQRGHKRQHWPSTRLPAAARGILQPGHAAGSRCLTDPPAASFRLSVVFAKAPETATLATSGAGSRRPGTGLARPPAEAAPAPALHAALCSAGCARYTFNLHVQLPWCGMRRGFACTSDHSCIQIPSVVTITTSTHVIKVITHTNWACDCMGISMIFLLFF